MDGRRVDHVELTRHYGARQRQSTAYVTAAFLDKTGTAATPTAISYRIDDVATGQEIRDDTAITPAASTVEITLTPADNAMVSARGRSRCMR